jgi:phage shock protein PspC (stress-responsive transcriptional regulator)
MLFHIEEDAYERLSTYLGEIKAYFNRIDTSGEVVQDIESRMAEVFSQKVGPAKQVITYEDVEQLIAQLGSVQDFAAAYSDEPVIDEPYTASYAETATSANPDSKKLFRDASHKILGGVASGIARYLKIDAIWVRLLLIIVMFDFFITFSFSTITFISYIVLWIVLPEKFYPKEETSEKTKKMYRNPDNRVLGGVAGGLGSYFGSDPTLIRIFFVLLFFFGGSGLLLYIVLWVITPEAKTLTEKMRMQGEPVTLTNIEHQVKKKLNLPENEEESILTKILLFPFRVISAIFSGGSNGNSFASALGRLVRIIVGLLLVFIGFLLLISLLAVVFAAFGAYPGISTMVFDNDFSLVWLNELVPTPLAIAASALLIIPALFVFLAGLAFLSSGWRVPKEISWGLAGLWVIALLVTLFMAPRVANNFAHKGYAESSLVLDRPDSAQVLNLKLDHTPFREIANFSNDDLDLTIEGSYGNEIVIEQRARARAENTELAQEIASKVAIPVKQEGNTIYFKDKIGVEAEEFISLQGADLTMRIPNGQRFTMSRGMGRILANTLSPYGYRVRDLGDNRIFYYNENSELVCENCPNRERGENRRNRIESNRNLSDLDTPANADYGRFSELSFSGALDVEIVQGNRFDISYSGDEADFRDVEIEKRGNRLAFSRGLRWNQSNDDSNLLITVTLPELDRLTISGASDVKLDFSQDRNMKINVNGASNLNGSLDLQYLEIDVNGASNANLRGSCQELRAEVASGSDLEAEDLRAEEVDVEVSTAGEAKVYAGDRLNADVNSGANLQYYGSPRSKNLNKSSGGEISSRN